jgi:Ca2+-binding RTX toxin-like protein
VSGAVPNFITPAQTQTSLTAATGPVINGQSVTLTASVAALAPGGGTPEGNVVFTGNGNDSFTLSDGASTITLGDRTDTVSAGNGNNTINVGNGNDTIFLGNADNIVVEGNGTDSVTAGNGSNLVVGGLGQHSIQLGAGNNILIDGSATFTQTGDSLRQVLSDWKASSAAAVNTRLQVTYNTVHPNSLFAGAGRNWFFFKTASDRTNREATDRLN